MKKILFVVAAWMFQQISIMLNRAKLYPIIVIALLSSAGVAQATIIEIDVEGSVFFGGPVIDDGTPYSANFIIDNSVASAPNRNSSNRSIYESAILGFTLEIAGVTIILDDFNERNDIYQDDVSGDRDQATFIIGNTFDNGPGRDADALSGTLNGFDAHNLSIAFRGAAGELYSDRGMLLDTAVSNSNSTNFDPVFFTISFRSLEAPFLANDIALTTDSISISEVSDEPTFDVPIPATLNLVLSGTAIMLLAAGRRKARKQGVVC